MSATILTHSLNRDAPTHAHPPQIVVAEQPKQLYKFLTAICAVIGGVFTVAGEAPRTRPGLAAATSTVVLPPWACSTWPASI